MKRGNLCKPSLGHTLLTNNNIYFSDKQQEGTAMSFSPFYLVHLSNEHYIEHVMRTSPPAAERQLILPYHNKPDSPCEHNLPTPCPPSTPILVQLTNSGRSQYVQSHQGPTDNLLQRLHSDLINRSAIYILNELNGSPAVEGE